MSCIRGEKNGMMYQKKRMRRGEECWDIRGEDSRDARVDVSVIIYARNWSMGFSKTPPMVRETTWMADHRVANHVHKTVSATATDTDPLPLPWNFILEHILLGQPIAE